MPRGTAGARASRRAPRGPLTDPRTGRAAFRLAMLIGLTSLAILPFQRPSSPEFVVTVMALAIGALFMGAVVLVARISDPGLPPREAVSKRDNGAASRSNSANETRGGINDRDQAT